MSLVWNSSYLHNLKILPFHGFWKISHVYFMGLKVCFLFNPFILSWNATILCSWSIPLVRLSPEFFLFDLLSLWYNLISVWVFFIVFSLLNSISMSWIVITISFLYLFMFSWNSLRSLFLFSLTSFSSLSVSLWSLWTHLWWFICLEVHLSSPVRDNYYGIGGLGRINGLFSHTACILSRLAHRELVHCLWILVWVYNSLVLSGVWISAGCYPGLAVLGLS